MAARKAPKPSAPPQLEHEAAKENVLPSDNNLATFPQEGEVLKKPQESEFRDWKISNLQMREDHILVNFTNGKTMSSKQANKIPELGMKLAEMYTTRLLAMWQVHKMTMGSG